MKARFLTSALLVAGLALTANVASADKLDDIKQAGVIRISVFDSNPHSVLLTLKPKNSRAMISILLKRLRMILE